MALIAMLSLVATNADAIVGRHDVDASSYEVSNAPAFLVNLPNEGHGSLIAPNWVVTAAHTVFYDYKGLNVEIDGASYEIEFVIFHEGYRSPADGIFSGDATRSQAYLSKNDDLALLRLKHPVTSVEPIEMYTGHAESSAIVKLYGKGRGGNGLAGQDTTSSKALRYAQNRIVRACDKWLSYRFDFGDAALPLEGMQGSGDSGGPALISINGSNKLAGLVSWISFQGDYKNFEPGKYGLEGNLIRISYYADWILEVQTWDEERLESQHNIIFDQSN